MTLNHPLVEDPRVTLAARELTSEHATAFKGLILQVGPNPRLGPRMSRRGFIDTWEQAFPGRAERILNDLVAGGFISDEDKGYGLFPTSKGLPAKPA